MLSPYLSFFLSLSCSVLSVSFLTVPELFCGEDFETFAVQLVILLPIKSPVASAVFWIALFEAVLGASVADCLA